MDVILLNAMNADSTAWLIETYGSSGDYDLIVFLNTPNWYGSNLTDAEILTNGFGKFGEWIGPNDVTITTDMLVLLPDYAEATGSVFTDSLGVIDDKVRDDTPSDWGSKVYGWYANENGDSLFMSLHDDYPCNYIDTTNTITVPIYRTGCDPDSIRAGVWISEKAAGSKVWIVPYGAASAQYGFVTAILSMYEPSFTPIDMATTITEFFNATDTTGCSTNLADLMSWHASTGWKTTIAVNQYYCSYRPWTDDWAARLAAKPDNFQLVIDGYTRFPFRDAAQTAAQTLTDCLVGLNSIRNDEFWSGLIDTTCIWPFSGQYNGAAGAPGAASILENVISQLGQTDLLTQCNIDQVGYGCTSLFGIEGAQRFRLSSGTMIDTHPTGYLWPTANNAMSSYDNIAYGVNMMAKGKVGAICALVCGSPTDYHLAHASGAEVARVGAYAGGGYTKALALANVTGGSYEAYQTESALDMPAYSAKLLMRFTKEYMDFHNNFAAAYTQTGIVPFRNVFIRDVHYDRVLDRQYPNQHVTEGGYE